MTQAGPAIPVMTVTDRAVDAGPALRVAVVSDGRPVEGGATRPVVVVSDGRPTQGNEPLPVVLATGAQASRVLAGPAMPVVVVSGSLNPFDPFAYTNKVAALGPIGYYPLAEASGTTVVDASGHARNGIYKSSGVTLGATGMGDGRTAAFFAGAGYGDLFAALSSSFIGGKGSVVAWFQVTAAEWIDAAFRQIIKLSADGSNIVQIYKNSTSNRMDLAYTAGGVTKQVNLTSFNPITWQQVALTWQDAANGDALKAYLNGVQQGATQTGNGTYAGGLGTLTSTFAASNTSTSSPWKGSLAHIAVFDRVLSAAEIASVYQQPP